ncbi:MAG: BatD family protein [Myxococcales bacterium]|nr:BatD family protein [Myxococcota bacterium]MDW8283459.1 BatD family protein [Myxococcales bacterium]
MRQLVVFAWVFLASLSVRAQQLQLQVESEELYANLPFVLSVIATGFDEEPQPVLSELRIPGCKVTPLGVSPSVSTMVQIIGGQRSETRNVTFVYRFRIEAPRAGQYTVPPLTAEQGKARAQSRAASLLVREMETTRDMQIRLTLPERPVWVGETIEAQLDWYLRRDVSNHTFVVPLFDLEDRVEVEPAPMEGPKLGGFHAGSRTLELPYTRDTAIPEGESVPCTRYRFHVRITPVKPGTLQAAPPRVMAELAAGTGRDVFGFAVPVTKLYQAVGKEVSLEVRAPPLSGRPGSFRNAVGSAFSIDVQAGRTVVRIGEPIELRILIRGKGRLAGLILPPLPAMGLAPEQFAAPAEPPSGEPPPDGIGRLFRVPVRLRSGEVRQIPPLAFSYFDPEQGTYRTVHSQPIALSVEGSAVVGASAVIGRPPDTPAPEAATSKSGRTEETGLWLAGVDLALSAPGETLVPARSLRDLLPSIVALYVVPPALLLVQGLRQRRRARRQAAAEMRRALAALERELTDAAHTPARDMAPRLAGALRTLCRRTACETTAAEALLTRLETEAYGPEARSQPLPRDLVEEARRVARLISGGLLLLLLGIPRPLAAAEDLEARLQAARQAYQAALAQPDRDLRRAGFARAEALYRELCTALPDRPALLSDWGNAALSAQEPGLAVLAYRRALHLDPRAERARRNLAALRAQLPDWLPRPPASGALDTLFFWQGQLSRPWQHLLGAALFAVAVLLAAPWSTGRTAWRRGLRVGALFGALLWVAVLVSVVLSPDESQQGVVVLPGVTLRSADSIGAPPALGRPLPAGTELVVREVRGAWVRVTLWNGQTGWLPLSAVARVVP